MANITQPLTGSLTRLPSEAADGIGQGVKVVLRPPAGFSFVRTVSGTQLRAPDGAFIVVPGA